MKNNAFLAASSSYNDEYFKGWAFLNHIGLIYYYGLVDALRKAGLDNKYAPAEVIKLTKNICRVYTPDGKYKISDIQTETKELLKRLGVNLLS